MALATKQEIYVMLERPRQSRGFARVCGFVLLGLIFLNVLAMLILTDSNIPSWMRAGLTIFELLSAIFFAGEYLLRLWTADLKYGASKRFANESSWRQRLRYALSPMGLIDLLAFSSVILAFVLPVSSNAFNAVRVLRLTRLFKITRYMKGLRVIERVLRVQRNEIVAAAMVLLLLVVASSMMMYYLESPAQPDAFTSAWTGMYWAMTTITSTGYGDLAPITAAGRVVGFLTMAFSVAVVAIPGGIFSAGFVAEFQKKEKGETPDDERG